MPRPKKKPPHRPEHDAELIQAIRDGDADWVVLLLEDGADPNARDARGNPAIYSVGPALSAGYVFGDRDARILQALLDAGADPKLDEVGLRLCRAAWRSVSSALEAHDATRLQRMLGVADADCRPSRG